MPENGDMPPSHLPLRLSLSFCLITPKTKSIEEELSTGALLPASPMQCIPVFLEMAEEIRDMSSETDQGLHCMRISRH